MQILLVLYKDIIVSVFSLNSVAFFVKLLSINHFHLQRITRFYWAITRENITLIQSLYLLEDVDFMSLKTVMNHECI